VLKGRLVNLELVERPDLPVLHRWVNDVDFVGEFEPFEQATLASLEKDFDAVAGAGLYFIATQDLAKVGYIAHFKVKDCTGIGYMLAPEARRQGFGTEAVTIMVDYLFLHKDIVRIQAETHPGNVGSQKVLARVGFSREGIIRQSFFSRGVYRDTALWSILRHEWGAPRILPLGYVGGAVDPATWSEPA
jgi:[ribosomal protein S5]-alanine N-acetyltransferase